MAATMTVGELIKKLQRHPPEKEIIGIVSLPKPAPPLTVEIFDTREFEEGVLLNCRNVEA